MKDLTVLTELQLHWLAGLLEGEGSFLAGMPSAPNKPQISIQSTDEDVIAKVAELWDVSYWSYHPEHYVSKGWKCIYICHLRGKRAVDLMKMLHPLMSSRRKAQIELVFTKYKPRNLQISEQKAMELAQRYWAGERHPTALGREYGISKNLAIHYIKKFAAMAQG